MRGTVQALGHIGIASGGIGVRLLDRGRGVEQRCRCDALDVAPRQQRIAVAREDDLALFGNFEEAVDRALGLGKHRAVRRSSAAPDRAAAPVHEHKVDIVLLRPRRDTRLRGMQRERGGSGAGVLEESE